MKRPERVGRALHDELASMIQSELADPRVANVVVTRVVLSSDLRHARVNVRVMGDADVAAQKRVLAGLVSASGFLRREVTARLSLRFAPELVFHYDTGQDASTRVQELLAEVQREEKK